MGQPLRGAARGCSAVNHTRSDFCARAQNVPRRGGIWGGKSWDGRKSLRIIKIESRSVLRPQSQHAVHTEALPGSRALRPQCVLARFSAPPFCTAPPLMQTGGGNNVSSQTGPRKQCIPELCAPSWALEAQTTLV